MKRVIIGLGSNLYNREEYLARALDLMAQRVGYIECCSSVTETEAWGFQAPPFLNQAVILRTILPPLALLDELQQIERELGRTRKSELCDGTPVYYNRTIDIDILDYDGIVYHDDRLTLPHPQIPYRKFIQEELNELLGKKPIE